jgi:hypothetical protein
MHLFTRPIQFLLFFLWAFDLQAQTNPDGQVCGVDKHHWTILPLRKVHDWPKVGPEPHKGTRVGSKEVEEAECILAEYLGDKMWSNQWDTIPSSLEDLEVVISEANTFWHYRQYIGARDPNGALLVYINAFCKVERSLQWRRHQVVVFDGGDCYWQAVINLTENRVEYFEENDGA